MGRISSLLNDVKLYTTLIKSEMGEKYCGKQKCYIVSCDMVPNL